MITKKNSIHSLTENHVNCGHSQNFLVIIYGSFVGIYNIIFTNFLRDSLPLQK